MWPHDDTESLIAFYGKPWIDPSLLTHVTPPFIMKYEGAVVHGLLIHVKCAEALTEALRACWDHYGHDQDAIDKTGLSNYSGSYNYRAIRGSSRLSCHAFGAAVDIDAEHNPLGSRTWKIPPDVVNAFKATGAFWGGDFQNRKDSQHFQWAHE